MTEIPHGLVTGKVVHKTEWTVQLFSLQVSAPVSPYQAGQFTKLGLQKHLRKKPGQFSSENYWLQ